MNGRSAAGSVALHAGHRIQYVEAGADGEVDVEQHVRELREVASDGEVPAHAVASLDQPEKILDTESQNHHGVRFRLRDVCDGVVFEKLRGEFDVVEFDFRGQGEALVIGKVGDMDAELFQLLVDSH